MPVPALMRWTSPRPRDRADAETVLELQRTRQYVGDDLHVAMRMFAEAPSGSDAVIVEHAQHRHAHVRRVVITGEGKAVAAVQPVEPANAALGGVTGRNHTKPPVLGPVGAAASDMICERMACRRASCYGTLRICCAVWCSAATRRARKPGSITVSATACSKHSIQAALAAASMRKRSCRARRRG